MGFRFCEFRGFNRFCVNGERLVDSIDVNVVTPTSLSEQYDTTTKLTSPHLENFYVHHSPT